MIKKWFSEHNSNHFISDLIKAVILSIVLMIVVKFLNRDNIVDSIYKLQQTAIGVWATIVGFVLTALSILVTVEKTKFIEDLIKTGHFKNLMKVFIEVCYMATIMLIASFIGAIVRLPDIYYYVECFVGVWSIKRLMSCFYVMKKMVIEICSEKDDEE